MYDESNRRGPRRQNTSEAAERSSVSEPMGKVLRMYPSPLTPTQQKTLEIAFERGYFEIPREVTIDELEREFDVSHQALSERLRRGIRALVRQELDRSTSDEFVESTFWVVSTPSNKARCYHSNPNCPKLLISDAPPKGVSEERADWYDLEACPLCLPERRQTEYPHGPVE